MAEFRKVAAAVGVAGIGLLTIFAGPAGADLTPGSTMQVSPTSTTAGTTVTVSGSGCQGNYTILVRLDGGNPVATSGDPSDDGWSVGLPVPSGTPAGAHTISAVCDSYGSTDDYPDITVNVTAPATPQTTATTAAPSVQGTAPTVAASDKGTSVVAAAATAQSLPSTGRSSGPLSLRALALVMAGVGFVLLAAHVRITAPAAPARPARIRLRRRTR